MPVHHEVEGREGEGTPSPPALPGTPIANGANRPTPRLAHRDGVAYVEGCDITIWQLERSRRVGSAPASLLRVFPELTPEGLELAFEYARQHPEEIDRLIRELGPEDVPAEDEADDEAEFQADLDELFERDAELFRRLAQ